jgi:hypothetical protein
MTTTAAAVVMDHTALALLGRGHPFLSGLVAAPAHRTGNRQVYVPALCLAAAIAERPAIGEHVLALPAVEVVSLGAALSLAVGLLVGEQVPWQHSHAVAVSRPNPEWPTGRPVITAAPDQYDGLFVDVIAVN